MLNEDFDLNFDTMKTSDDCIRVKEIRRLTTLSDSAINKSQWLWYFQADANNNDNWIKYSTKDNCDIENAYNQYLSNKLLSEFKMDTDECFKRVIHFDTMTIELHEKYKTSVFKLRRRPKPLYFEDDEHKKGNNSAANAELIELVEYLLKNWLPFLTVFSIIFV